MRILYQPYMGLNHSAVGLIDQGFINAIEQAGQQCLILDADRDEEKITAILESFCPTHFIGYLQNAHRNNTAWTNESVLTQLCDYKKQKGLYVAIDSAPSNIKDLFQDFLPSIESHTQEGVASYYLQDDRPNSCEQYVLESGLIDVISSRFSAQCFPVAYKNFLDMGMTIIEMPPAADSTVFHSNNTDSIEQDIDLLYIGGCWSFKWDNMKQYIIPLKEKYGQRFKIYGRGWPEGIAEGPLGDGVSDNQLFIDYTRRARVNLAFHEPSQVLSFATSGNERVYKLLALGACVLSDPCATFEHYFKDGRDLLIARNGEDMLLKAEQLLKDSEKRQTLAKVGKQTVFYEHTYAERLNRLLDIPVTRSSNIINYKDLYE